MAHPVAVFTLLKSLPSNAPELIREVNPCTWIERIIRENHQFRLAAKEIEKQCQRDKQEHERALQELEARKEAFKESLRHQIELLETQNEPTMLALQQKFKTIDEFNKESHYSHKIIWDMAGKVDIAEFESYVKMHMLIFDKQKFVFDQVRMELDKHHGSISSQFELISRQISDHTRALGKD